MCTLLEVAEWGVSLDASVLSVVGKLVVSVLDGVPSVFEAAEDSLS